MSGYKKWLLLQSVAICEADISALALRPFQIARATSMIGSSQLIAIYCSKDASDAHKQGDVRMSAL